MMCVWRLSVCLTSVAYIGSKLRTERPRKTKIGMEVAHVTWLGHHFQGQKVKGQLAGAGHIVAASRIACSLSDFTYLPQVPPTKLCRTNTHNFIVCASSCIFILYNTWPIWPYHRTYYVALLPQYPLVVTFQLVDLLHTTHTAPRNANSFSCFTI